MRMLSNRWGEIDGEDEGGKEGEVCGVREMEVCFCVENLDDHGVSKNGISLPRIFGPN